MSEVVNKCEKMEVARQDELLLGAKRRLEFDQRRSHRKRVLQRSRYVNVNYGEGEFLFDFGKVRQPWGKLDNLWMCNRGVASSF